MQDSLLVQMWNIVARTSGPKQATMSSLIVPFRLQLPVLIMAARVLKWRRKASVWVLMGWAPLLPTSRTKGMLPLMTLKGLRKNLLSRKELEPIYRTLTTR